MWNQPLNQTKKVAHFPKVCDSVMEQQCYANNAKLTAKPHKVRGTIYIKLTFQGYVKVPLTKVAPAVEVLACLSTVSSFNVKQSASINKYHCKCSPLKHDIF